MTKRALVGIGTRIFQVVDANDEFPVAAPLRWIDVPDDVTTHYLMDPGEAPIPPPEELGDDPEVALRARAFDAILEQLIDEPKFNATDAVATYRGVRRRS